MIEKEGSDLEREKTMCSRRWGKLRRSQEKRQGRKHVSVGRKVSRGRGDDRVCGQEREERGKNEGIVLSRRQPGGKIERLDTRNNPRCQSAVGIVAFGAKVKVRSMGVVFVMWCLWWINMVRGVGWRLVVKRSVPGRGEVWYPCSELGERRGSRREIGQRMLLQFSPRFWRLGWRWFWDPGVSAGVIWVYAGVLVRTVWIRRSRGVKEKCRMSGRKEVGQGKLFQFSPRFLQLGLRWAWDPGVSAGVLWVYVGLMVRTAWIRRSRGVKEKCRMSEVQDDRKIWIVLTSWFCDPCNGA